MTQQDTTVAFSSAARHLMGAAEQVRRFGPSGEPAARELARLAELVANEPARLFATVGLSASPGAGLVEREAAFR